MGAHVFPRWKRQLRLVDCDWLRNCSRYNLGTGLERDRMRDLYLQIERKIIEYLFIFFCCRKKFGWITFIVNLLLYLAFLLPFTALAVNLKINICVLCNYSFCNKTPAIPNGQLVSQSAKYKQQKWTLKNCSANRPNKFSKATIAVRFNLLHVCPSVHGFLFAMSFIPLFLVLSSDFSVSLRGFVADPVVWILINFMIRPASLKRSASAPQGQISLVGTIESNMNHNSLTIMYSSP